MRGVLLIDGMTLPLLACFAGGPVLLIIAILMWRQNRGVAVLLGIAAVSLVGASALFLTGNRRHEMTGIPYIVMGGLAFWGLFVPTLASAVYLHGWKKQEHR